VTLALVLTIALGIGSNAAVQGFVRGLIVRDLPLPAADKLVSVFAWDEQRRPGPVSFDEFLSLRGRANIFERLGAASESQSEVVLADDWSVMSVTVTSPELADLLQLSFDGGVLVSHRVWQQKLDATADVRGVSVRIDDVPTHVSGVAPEWLEGLYLGRPVDIWMPMREGPPGPEPDRGGRHFWLLGRLRADVSVAKAQTGVTVAGSESRAFAVLAYTGMTPEMSSGLARIAGLLRAAAAAVFLIACANVASFLMARATARSHETSIRLAVGAGRAQLVRLLLSDSVLISLAGTAAGLLLTVWTMQIVPALFFEQDAEQLVFAPDFAGIVIVSVTCAGITIACGLVPLLQIRHDQPSAVLQRESAGPPKSIGRLRSGLVAAQMTCCCLLVISTGLLLQGFKTALQTGVSRRLGQAMLVTVQARSSSTSSHERTALALDYFHRVESTAQSLANASAAAWVATPPASLPSWQFVRVETPEAPVRDVGIDVAVFTPGSMALVDVPPVAGRLFSGADTPDACTVVVVNKEAADALFDADTVGRSIEDPLGERIQIVGAVATHASEKRPKPNRPTVYFYADQRGPMADRLGPALFHVPAPSKLPIVALDANVVSASYFDAMGFVSTSGAIFKDEPATGCRVGVVNQEAAERYFGGHAVGASVIDPLGRRTDIVGVVRSTPLRSAQRRMEPAIYFPMTQDVRQRMTLVLAVREADGRVLADMRAGLRRVPGGDPTAIVVTTLDAQLARTTLAPERIGTVLVGVFAATALALGVLGLYGAMTDAVIRRRREMALCLALGAQGWRLIRQLVVEGVRLATAGTIAGMLGSVLLARWLARIVPTDGSSAPWVWIAAPLALLAAVIIASVLPVRRALMVDPLSIMRDT